MVYCTHCGEENSEDSVFCLNCGHKIKESKENNGGKEVLQEMVYVRWNLNKGNKLGTRLYQKIFYFTDQNIYIW